MSLLIQAIHYASYQHLHQRRKNKEASPYIHHPLTVMYLLSRVANVADPEILAAAVLHDTVEDTSSELADIESRFGSTVAAYVKEVSDDQSLPKTERKRLQVVNASKSSLGARLIKLADKTANLQDLVESPPAHWSAERIVTYLHWSKEVVDELRGVHQGLEELFDETFLEVKRAYQDTE